MLADGQDPDALEARLAYHLHRLQLTGQPLRDALKGKAYLATALSQARASVNHDFIEMLATSLNIAADELNRSPTDDESREWSFYRNSARNPKDVWRHASELWKQRGVSDKQAASIIGMKHPNLSRALSGKPVDVFDWQYAQRLSEAINVTPPERFLPPELDKPTNNRPR